MTEPKGKIAVTSLTTVPASMMLVAYLSGGSVSSAPAVSFRMWNENAGGTGSGSDAMESLQEREGPWLVFLARQVAPDGPFSAEQVAGARRLWRMATTLVTKDLPLPSTRESGEGTLLLVWDTASSLVELEVFANGSFAWFARDRKTAKYSGSNDEPLMHFPVELLDRLSEAFPSLCNVGATRAA